MGPFDGSVRMEVLSNARAAVACADEFNLKLSTKRLKSGKCQVKFSARVRAAKDLYGYVLVDSDQTLKSVVNNIEHRLQHIQQATDFQQIHLYSIGKRSQDRMSFIFFDHT
ncbi:MAG: hypothetical protein AAGA85_16170 [Bacteroidota bacterium]